MKLDVLDKGYVSLVDSMGTDLAVVNSARVSYDKSSSEFSERDARLLKFLIREGHTSTLRHAALTFEIYAPLMVARQWWKYVIASTHVDDQNGWNESSRRYVTEREEFYIPEPEGWRSAPEDSKQGSGPPLYEEHGIWPMSGWTDSLERHVLRSVELYERALGVGMAPEQARLFLPAYGMYVRWRWTVSLAGLLHFLGQRLEHDAQLEIQEYARAVRAVAEPVFPETFRAVFE